MHIGAARMVLSAQMEQVCFASRSVDELGSDAGGRIIDKAVRYGNQLKHDAKKSARFLGDIMLSPIEIDHVHVRSSIRAKDIVI